MNYEIRLEKTFIKRMDNLGVLFDLSADSVKLARENIIDALELLATGEPLPDYFFDHALQKEPWNGYREFHALEDLLVVYFQINTKKRIRIVTITSHEELSSGKLQN
jgi:mRNA interferase YafQ